MYLMLCDDPEDTIFSILLAAPFTARHLSDNELDKFVIPKVENEACMFDFLTTDRDFDEHKLCLDEKLLDRSANDKTDTES
jgi:hypothetical protein